MRKIEPKYMKPLRYPTNKEQAAYMKLRTDQNLLKSQSNRAENWFSEKLKQTRFRWTRQACWGYRIFDFWCHELGIAVEIDGQEHNKEYDSYRDEYNFRRSGIKVLRVRNFNEEDAILAVAVISSAESWIERRNSLCLNIKSRKARRHLVSGQSDLFE